MNHLFVGCAMVGFANSAHPTLLFGLVRRACTDTAGQTPQALQTLAWASPQATPGRRRYHDADTKGVAERVERRWRSNDLAVAP